VTPAPAPRRWYLAAPLALAVVAVAGSGIAAHAANARAKNRAPDDATQRVVHGLGPASHVQGAELAQGLNGTTVTINLDRNNEDTLTAWEAQLAVGAIGELTRSNQDVLSEEVFSATAVGPNRAGATTTSGLGVGAARLGQRFDSPSDATLNAHAADVAQQFGVKLAAFEVQHPLESAIKVTYVVPDGADVTWTLDDLRTALVGSTPNVEGAFIELDSPSGDPLLGAGSAYRSASGILWFAPGQDNRFSAGHGALDTRQ
jgi:hypothetical protein